MDNNTIVYIFIFAVASLGYYWGALSLSGAIASVLVGSVIYNGFNIEGLILLGVFFGTSTFWSKYKQEKKKGLEEKLQKTDRRDWVQVFANGGIAAIISIFYITTDYSLLLLLFIVSLAAANSDTWASEIGTLSKQKPLLLTTFKRVEKGTSGAVSLLGTAASIAGAFIIVYFAFLLAFPLSVADMIIITTAAFLGNLIDTVLGATIQSMYKCPVCHTETERSTHCSYPSAHIKGLKFCNNDVINALSNLLAVLVTGLLYILIKNG